MKRSHVKTKEENAKFLRLLSIALPSDYMLLHPSYCPDLNTKMKNEEFFFNFLSPCTNSHKEQHNYDVCVNMQIQNNDNERY